MVCRSHHWPLKVIFLPQPWSAMRADLCTVVECWCPKEMVNAEDYMYTINTETSDVFAALISEALEVAYDIWLTNRGLLPPRPPDMNACDYYLNVTLKRMRKNHIYSKNWKTTFEHKLPIFSDKSCVMCQEIFSACARPAQKLEISILHIFYWRWTAVEIDYKLQADGSFICSKALVTPARQGFKSYNCLEHILPSLLWKLSTKLFMCVKCFSQYMTF